MEYRLIWNGRLWSITIPEELESCTDEKIRWTYAQTYAATGGSKTIAMIRTLMMQYPGLGYTGAGPIHLPVSVVSVAAKASGVAADVCGSDMSAPSSTKHTGSQRPRPPVSTQATKGAVSGTSVQHKPSPRPATSSASLPLFRQTGGSSLIEKPRRPMQPAKQSTGGWMGSAPTSAGAR